MALIDDRVGSGAALIQASSRLSRTRRNRFALERCPPSRAQVLRHSDETTLLLAEADEVLRATRMLRRVLRGLPTA